MGSFRKQRVSELLLSFLGGELRKLTDPRVSFVTLTGVEMSADLKHARVYWTVLGSESGEKVAPGIAATEFPGVKCIEDAQEALSKLKSLLRKRVGAELNLRYTPNLNFLYDRSLETGARIDQLLAQSAAEE